MELLEVGDEITFFVSGDVSRIGRVSRVTPKRAYVQAQELRREVKDSSHLILIGLGDWSRTSASMTTDEHRKAIERKRKIIKAKRYFEDLIRDETRLLDAYDKVGCHD